MTTGGDDTDDLLRRAMGLAAKSPDDALALLDGGLAQARNRCDPVATAKLARHAGVLADASGGAGRAADYLRVAVVASPDEALLRVALANSLEKMGDISEAREHYAVALGLFRRLNDAGWIRAVEESIGRLAISGR